MNKPPTNIPLPKFFLEDEQDSKPSVRPLKMDDGNFVNHVEKQTIEAQNVLYLKNLKETVTEFVLKQTLSEFGDIGRVTLRLPQLHEGEDYFSQWAVVEMGNSIQAKRVLDNVQHEGLANLFLLGKKKYISYFLPKSKGSRNASPAEYKGRNNGHLFGEKEEETKHTAVKSTSSKWDMPVNAENFKVQSKKRENYKNNESPIQSGDNLMDIFTRNTKGDYEFPPKKV
eukprot:TRINITY_DN4572_c0_g1_i5.p2 TRINITY_DN4572_c0_g1~~TRINITY_DN4572_c0_g1_i5.p2  ORF type:complete len:227 (-),score=33.42 TRINITY_DN4572_c0_g1_i5:970-1650(-)